MLHKKSKEIEEKKNIKGYSLKKGRNIIKLRRLQKNFYEFEKFQLINQKDIKLVGLFGDKFHSFAKKNKILIVTENRARDRSQNCFMKKCGLRIKYTNQLFTKNLRNFKSNYKDTLNTDHSVNWDCSNFLESTRYRSKTQLNNTSNFESISIR